MSSPSLAAFRHARGLGLVGGANGGALTAPRHVVGTIQAHGREDVADCFDQFFAAFDTVQLVDSAGEAVADRILIHYRLHVTRGPTRFVCTQTAVCRLVDEQMATIDLLCSGLGEMSP
jgi:hypothetical protein